MNVITSIIMTKLNLDKKPQGKRIQLILIVADNKD